MPLALPVTGWTAVVLATLMLGLTARVILYRRERKISLGDGGDRQIARAMRAQGNAVEQVPITLIVLGLAELAGMTPWVLAPLALAFVAGRVMHAAHFLGDGKRFGGRVGGMVLTLTAQTGLILALAVALLT